MPANIEVKIKINSFDKVKKILHSMSLKPSAVLNQKDIYYEAPKGLLKLRITDEKTELIKYLRDEKSQQRISDYKIIEITNVGDPEKFFRTIFNHEAVVEKTRTLYLYKNTRIHLDRVNNLGKFIELESVIKEGKKKTLAEFKELVNKLGIDLKKQIRKSYRDLIK